MRADEGQANAAEEASGSASRASRLGHLAFGETANPAEYVPREASENALLELERLIRRGRTTALTAPPGLGKSLLLRILGRRLSPGFECLFLPYAAVTLAELCAWSLGLLGVAAKPDPEEALVAQARERGERGEVLVLLIDDAGSMPLETARELGRLVRDSGNRVRVVMGAGDDAASSRVLAALHPEIAEIRFTEPMAPHETRLYVETRLEQAGVPAECRARFGAETLGWIHRLSGGVPRRVHDLASSLLEEPPDGVGRAWAEERWLGAPLGGIDDADLEGFEDLEDKDEGVDLELEPSSYDLELLTDEDDPEIFGPA